MTHALKNYIDKKYLDEKGEVDFSKLPPRPKICVVPQKRLNPTVIVINIQSQPDERSKS